MGKNVTGIILVIEAALIAAGMLMKQDMWVPITCYWIIVLMKNMTDLTDGRRGKHDGKRDG